jgi:asparagine synthetase B (glutamine-hydrolysing)
MRLCQCTKKLRLRKKMPKLLLSISDPDAQVIELPDAVWVLSGFEKSDVQRLRERNEADGTLKPKLLVRPGDVSVVKVHLSSGQATLVEVYKPAVSCREVFYCRTSNGDILLSDHFRTILSLLRPIDRIVDPASIVDFFLFNSVPGTRTICSGINRVGQGDSLSIDLTTQQFHSSTVDRIETREIPGSEDDYLNRLDSALTDVIQPLRLEPRIANLFSGGIDSVLIHTYLGNAVPALHMKFDSLETDSPYEAGYARQAANLLDLDLEIRPIREVEYLDLLERTVDALGRPPLFLTMVFYNQALNSNYCSYVNGEAAGLLFGEGARLARAASYFASPLGILFLKQLSRWLPASTRPGGRLLLPRAVSLSKDPCAPLGFGRLSAMDTDLLLMDKVFGSQIVRDRLDARFEYVMQRIVPAAPITNPFLQHIEIAHWMNYLVSDHSSFWRQLAQAYSKSLFMPFTSERLISATLEIPIRDRYMKGLQGKYLLKELLRRRLPDYPVYQRKGYSHISFERYYQTGPLRNIWDQYQLPDFLNGNIRDLILNTANPLTWHAIAYAIWRDRVLKDSNLRAVPSRYSWEWPCWDQRSTHNEIARPESPGRFTARGLPADAQDR